MKGKKAQEGGTGKEIAVLILLIGVFMVLYVLLLPPAERNQLLNETAASNVSGGAAVKTLLVESPGQLSQVSQSTITHDIQPINIFMKTQPTTVNLADSLTITKSLFGGNSQTLTFPIEDLSNLKDVTFFFSVKGESGTLQIKLNNNLVFSDQVQPGDIKLISLPINFIQKTNIIELSVSSPGLFFWATNKYVLENVGIKENFELINPKEERIVTIPKSELDNLQKASLSYYLYCNSLEGDNTRLSIYVNDHQSLSSVISCVGTSSSVEIPHSYFNEDENKITFVIEKGDFTISNIKLVTQLNQNIQNTYHLSLLGDDYNNVASGTNGVGLSFEFASNDTSTKMANIFVNGQQLSVDTTDTSYNLDITKYVNQGDNVIQIVPENTFTLNLLKVYLS